MKPGFKYLPDVWRVYHFVNLKFTVVRAATLRALRSLLFHPFLRFSFPLLLVVSFILPGSLCFLSSLPCYIGPLQLSFFTESSVLPFTSVTFHCVFDSFSLIHLNYRCELAYRLRFPSLSFSLLSTAFEIPSLKKNLLHLEHLSEHDPPRRRSSPRVNGACSFFSFASSSFLASLLLSPLCLFCSRFLGTRIFMPAHLVYECSFTVLYDPV